MSFFSMKEIHLSFLLSTTNHCITIAIQNYLWISVVHRHNHTYADSFCTLGIMYPTMHALSSFVSNKKIRMNRLGLGELWSSNTNSETKKSSCNIDIFCSPFLQCQAHFHFSFSLGNNSESIYNGELWNHPSPTLE